jgi:hypothetical protein
MKRYLPFLIIICSCSTPSLRHDIKEGNASSDIKAKIFKSEYGGFGYDIQIDGNLLVHQPNVPVINRYQGFATIQDAQSVADLVVMKIRNYELPPTLTAVELAHCIK